MTFRSTPLAASLAGLLFLVPVSVLGDTCVDYDEPYELLGEFELGDNITAIALDAPVSLLHVTYEFPCCGGNDTGSRTVVVDVSDPGQTVFLDSYERPGSDPPEPLEHVTADGGVVCGFVTDGPEDELYVGDATGPSDITFVTMTIAGFSGTSTAVLRAGRLYAANGNTFVIIDVSDPSSPSEVGRVTTGLAAAEMVAGDGVVYVAGGATFWTADVSNPEHPEVAGTIGLSHALEHVVREGDRAYVFGEDVLTVIGMSDPSAPVERGSLGISGNDIAVQGEHVIVAQSAILVFVNVSDPDAPEERGAVAGPTLPSYGFPPGYEHIVADGLTVYTGHSYYLPPDGGLGGGHIFHQLSPPDDAIVTTVTTPTAIGEFVVEGLQGTAMAQSLEGELYVFDLSAPTDPELIGYVATSGNHTSHARRGNLACLASRDEGLAIVDLSDPTAPTIVGTDVSEPAADVAMSPGIAYVTGEYDLRVVDLSDPSAPTTVGRLEGLWGTSPWGSQVMVSTGDVVLLGTYEHFHVIDASVPTRPRLIGSLEIEGGVAGIVVHGQFAFAAGGSSMRTIDLADPSDPVIVATTPDAGGRSMTIIDNALYAGGGTAYGFHVIDITDPLAPSIVGRYTSSTWGISLALANRDGFLLSAGVNGLTVLWPQCGLVGFDDSGDPHIFSGTASKGRLSVHPSPPCATAVIRLADDAPGAARLVARVIDVRGRVVDEVVLHRQDRGYAGMWETDRHAGGVYFVGVETLHGFHSKRIVVLH